MALRIKRRRTVRNKLFENFGGLKFFILLQKMKLAILIVIHDFSVCIYIYIYVFNVICINCVVFEYITKHYGIYDKRMGIKNVYKN